MQVRQISSCTSPAVWMLPRLTSRRTLLWELYMCDRHDALAAQLTGAHNPVRRGRQPVNREVRCGTLHDHQPIEGALALHGRTWLVLQTLAGTWLEQLTEAAQWQADIDGPDAAALAEIVRVAAAGPDDPAVQVRVLDLLARAETAAVERRWVAQYGQLP
ncbi:hypothetical protein GCM10018980_51500 [Streptomyces capoamus]|uniref:Uncharacterized protein n=1 Tax=Streptomyces capoamus TaxID=68183 RepID=A0A919EZ72_9ACTN|nr:hypothetical protein [Streptomyces capoamus]GGW15799.1 hypothetical protein GCM10010501_29310 [Streptomyces libani subsp. rufus]GHG61950.1 hypothetical protein GCM10018980_51500 [Streptomyces capoamus]